MAISQSSPTGQANPALLHRFLGIGLVILATGSILASYFGITGELPDGGSRLPAYAIAGVSFVLCAAALILLKPSVPKRRGGQTVSDYWSDPAVVAKAFLFWFILEGSGVMASVSYFLGNHLVAPVLMVLAIAAFWMNGPDVFTRD